jgi:plastocyanin
VLDSDPASPFAAEEAVTFTAPGTYDYYCAIHGNEMKGRIVVQ